MRVSKKYIILLIAAFIFAYIDGGKLAYSLFFFMLFLFMAGAVDIILHTKDISVNINFDKNTYETGDTAEFNMTVKNKGILPASVVVVKNNAYSDFNSKYNGDAFSIGIHESKQSKLNISFVKRGVYNFGNISLGISDLFAIFNKSKNIIEDRPVKVYPRIYTLKSIATTGSESFETLSNKKGSIEDMSTIDDIRKYRIGDSLKRIHWRVSAKHGELYTKNFDTLSGEECNLLLDMNRSGYFIDNAEAAEEKLIELLCSVAEYMNQKGIKSSVYISSDNISKFEIKSGDDMEVLREFFLYNYSIGDQNFTRFIEANSREFEKASWLGMFVPRVSLKAKGVIKMLKYAGYNITVFYISNDQENLQNIVELKNSGVEVLSFGETLGI